MIDSKQPYREQLEGFELDLMRALHGYVAPLPKKFTDTCISDFIGDYLALGR